MKRALRRMTFEERMARPRWPFEGEKCCICGDEVGKGQQSRICASTPIHAKCHTTAIEKAWKL